MPDEDVEARRVLASFDPGRLQVGRELRALSQTGLARRLDISPAAISQFEHGRTKPSAERLIDIAEVLDLPLGYFVARPVGAVPAPNAYFRSLRSTSVGDRRKAAALADLVRDLVNVLEQHVELPAVNLPDLRAWGRADTVETAAAVAREKLGLDAHSPVPNVVQTLERHGVVTARFRVSDADTVDAFSVAYDGRPVIVLGSDKGVRDRSRFDAAHELAHLLLHDVDEAGTKEIERQAHRFAAAFLMPEDGIVDHLPRRTDWSRLVALKSEWQVSIAALLMRAKDLGVMRDSDYLAAVKAMSARGWRKREPGDLGAPERPRLLAAAIQVAEENGTTLDELATEAGLPLTDLRTILAPTALPRPRVQI